MRKYIKIAEEYKEPLNYAKTVFLHKIEMGKDGFIPDIAKDFFPELSKDELKVIVKDARRIWVAWLNTRARINRKNELERGGDKSMSEPDDNF